MKLRLFTALVLGWISGCASVSSYQTARVLPPNDLRTVLGVTQVQTPAIESDGTLATKSYTTPEMSVQLGVFENWQFGATYTVPATARIDIKHRLYNGVNNSWAYGASVAYLAVNNNQSIAASTKSFSVTVMDFMFPFYYTHDFEDNLALTLIPKYLYRKYFGVPNAGGHYVGGSINLQIGITVGVMIEFSYLHDLAGGEAIRQFGGAIFVGSSDPRSYYKSPDYQYDQRERRLQDRRYRQ